EQSIIIAAFDGKHWSDDLVAPLNSSTSAPTYSLSSVAQKAIDDVYQANKVKLGQPIDKAGDLGNGFLKQSFEKGHITWNGQQAIPYFVGIGNALPNINFPSTVKPLWNAIPFINTINVPDGRHTYPGMRGSSQYNFDLKGHSNRVNIALNNTLLKNGDFKATLYRINSHGLLQQIPPTNYNITDNHLTFNNVPKGKYMVKVDVNLNKAFLPYQMIVNLDQAGSYFSKPDPLGMLPYNFGNIGGKRVTFNEHLGAPNGDIDAYRFTTDGVPRKLMLAVRDPKGSELVNSKVTVGLFDANYRPVSYKVVNGIIEANLKPNSQYYINMRAQPGVGTNYQLVANLLGQSSPLQVPPGRHQYNVNISTHDVLGNKLHNFYNFKLENKGTVHWAIRDTTLKQGDFEFSLYKDGRQWGHTLKPAINEALQFKDLPPGNYQVRVNVSNSSKNGSSYKTVFNLDEAGQTLAQARNLGKLTDQKGRLVVNDHVGIPTGDLDYYKFSTDSNRRLLQFAVRHPSGNGSLPLEGNVEFILYDKNGKVLKTVNSANKKAIFDTYELAPNSEYYVRIKAHSGNLGNYQLVLNGEVKRNPVGGSGKYYPELASLSSHQWDIYSGDNTRFGDVMWPGEVNESHLNPSSVKQIYTNLSTAILGRRYPMSAGYLYDKSYAHGTKHHTGIDFAAPAGTQVKTVVGGATTLIQNIAGNYFVGVKGDDGNLWIYGHLGRYYVSMGKRIEAGTTIGHIMATNSHLHLEVQVGHSYKQTLGAVTKTPANLKFAQDVTISPLEAYWKVRNR
ncbi:MAG: M23 family metallopeptidase, partial [Planktothrix sp.]